MTEIPGPQPDDHELARQESNLPERRRFDEFEPERRKSHELVEKLINSAGQLESRGHFDWHARRWVVNNEPGYRAFLAIAELVGHMNLDPTALIQKIDPAELDSYKAKNLYNNIKGFLEANPEQIRAFNPYFTSGSLTDILTPNQENLQGLIRNAYIAWLEEESQEGKEVTPSERPGLPPSGMVTPASSLRDFTPEQLVEAEQDWHSIVNEVQQQANIEASLKAASKEYDEMIEEVHEEESHRNSRDLSPEEVLEDQEQGGMEEEISEEFHHDPTLPPHKDES